MINSELVFEGCTNSYANSFYRLVFFQNRLSKLVLLVQQGLLPVQKGGWGYGGVTLRQTVNIRGGVRNFFGIITSMCTIARAPYLDTALSYIVFARTYEATL